MNLIKAIIVDDEESARDVLSNLLMRYCPQIEVLAKAENVELAKEAIALHQPDLVFLDIEMPRQSGFQLLSSIEAANFQVIFVTAYDQHAIRAFEFSAVDYLLKPIDIDRLKEAVERVVSSMELQSQLQQLQLLKDNLETKQAKQLVINDKGNNYVVDLNQIIALEAQEAYCMIHTTEKNFLISKNLKYYERLFETSPQFIRVHKSWIINTNHIVDYSKAELQMTLTGGIVAKLSKYKKLEFEDVYLK